MPERVFERLPWSQFTTQDLAVLFPGSEDRRYGLVKRALASGEIIRIRRGLYCLAPKYQKKSMNLYALAQHVHGPSYVSLESALSWHGWIPEAVHAVTSVSFKKSKEFKTPLGIFSYDRVPQQVFYSEVERLADASGNVLLMARPLKALADYVYVRKREWAGIEAMASDLRIEPEELEQITGGMLDTLSGNYSDPRVKRFLERLREDLNL
ncbi:MAG: type IV toxin-antitoxin system AbiEi family antitoxin domain-containing protein [Phycisphaerales bacterium]